LICFSFPSLAVFSRLKLAFALSQNMVLIGMS
jgi:hypothetical protein